MSVCRFHPCRRCYPCLHPHMTRMQDTRCPGRTQLCGRFSSLCAQEPCHLKDVMTCFGE